MGTFDRANNRIPHLFMELGYNRVTDWMVHVWDGTGVGIGEAQEVISTQGEREEACQEAATQLQELLEEKEAEG